MSLERVLRTIEGMEYRKERKIIFPYLNPGKKGFYETLKELDLQPLKIGRPEAGISASAV